MRRLLRYGLSVRAPCDPPPTNDGKVSRNQEQGHGSALTNTVTSAYPASTQR